MLGISSLFGGENQVYEAIASNISFGIHVAIPAIVQSYNAAAQTIEAKPAIRERTIKPSGEITYTEYPLLINVPVAFLQAGNYSITLPIAKGDECIILFSDLAIDNWWKAGSIQNPIEQRRHDLSDGMAIFGLRNQAKLKKLKKPAANALAIYNAVNGAGITVTDRGGTISSLVTRTVNGKTVTKLETATFEQIIKAST